MASQRPQDSLLEQCPPPSPTHQLSRNLRTHPISLTTPPPSLVLSANIPDFTRLMAQKGGPCPRPFPCAWVRPPGDSQLVSASLGPEFVSVGQKVAGMESTRTRNKQPRLCDRPHFIWSFPPKRLPAEPHDMCKSPPESWASQCVKKAPHGAELCNHKKREGEKLSPRKPGWDICRPKPGHVPTLPLALGPFSPTIVLFQVLHTLGL